MQPGSNLPFSIPRTSSRRRLIFSTGASIFRVGRRRRGNVTRTRGRTGRLIFSTRDVVYLALVPIMVLNYQSSVIAIILPRKQEPGAAIDRVLFSWVFM